MGQHNLSETCFAGAKQPSVDIRFHDQIPEFVERALEVLYECHMTTLLRFGQHYSLDCASTYVCHVDGVLRSVFVFRLDGHSLLLYNEQIRISRDELSRFVHAVFAAYPAVRRISLYAVDAPGTTLPYPCLRMSCLEDISLELPDKLTTYEEMLGKNMNYHIKRFRKKLDAAYSDVRRDCLHGGNVPIETILTIIRFSRMRMAAKGQTCYHTDEETERTSALVRRYGLVYTFTIDGELAAGVIVLRIEATDRLLVVAHHPQYDHYSLGTLCCYEAISNAIAKGAGRFNFGWGRFEYKRRLAGRMTELYRFDIFRTRTAMFNDIPLICQRAWSAARRRVRLWSAAPADEGSMLSQRLRRMWNAARVLRNRMRA